MNPEVKRCHCQSASERMDIQMGQEEAKRDLADVKKASGRKKQESQMETAVKKLLGASVQGMTLEQIMKLSNRRNPKHDQQTQTKSR